MRNYILSYDLRNKIDVHELIHDVFKLESKLFTKMESYRIIEQKCSEKCLSYDERQQLNVDINYAFERLIKILNTSCPFLTDEDILYCCLIKTGLENLTVGRCVGSLSRQSLNQRKYRIKKKMKLAECYFLFEMIFL